MPLQKPSPHRFIAPTAPSSTPKTKPKSNLRHAITAHTPNQTSELQFKKITPAKRFVVAPAQPPIVGDATPRAPDRVEEPDSSASTDYTPRPRQQRKLGRVESIEEASQSSPLRPADEDGFGVVQTIEHEPIFCLEEEDEVEHAALQDEEDDELLFETLSRLKRRRTSPPSPTLTHQRHPETPAAASHRFRFAHTPQTPIPFSNLNALASTAQPPTTTTAVTASTPAPQRPHFILPAPPTSPQKPSKPLPEIFSPSRKTQKYISAGFASTVQGWIIEAAQGSTSSHHGVVYGREREDGVRLKVRVTGLGPHGRGNDEQEIECWPGGVVFLRGDTEPGMYNASRAEGMEGEELGMKILLAGQGGARGSGGLKIRVGGVVGIKAPTWDVDVGGERWTVGVDWIML